MQHVLLRHEGDVLLKGSEIGMQITTVEQDRSLARQRPTGHDVHQRRLACAVGTDDSRRTRTGGSQAGAVQDALRCRRPGPVDPHIIADAPHLQLDIATLPRPVSAEPSNVSSKGPILMRSPGTRDWAPRTSSPLT